MADNYDLSTLLPTATLQQILQHYASPSFSDKSGYNSHVEDREWGLHFFTGRVPTPEEFYYGVYIDRIGDTKTDQALTLTERHLGYVFLRNNAYEHASSCTVDVNMRMHGAIWPEGATFTAQSNLKTRCEPDPNADSTWMLDWAFSSSHTNILSGGNRAALRTWRDEGKLVSAKPTWFMLNSSSSLMLTHDKSVDSRDTNNAFRARIQQVRDENPERRPMMIGTVGELGSGADLELATGADDISDSLNLISLRVLGTAPA